jgi:hypothetical protein
MNTFDVKSIEAENRSGEYQAVCGWSIAAFALGFLSISAFAAPVLWAVPLLGIVCAAVAMWRINRSRGELIGWNLALLGLILAIIFGVAAPTRTVTRWIWLKQRSEVFAAEFIRLLQENQPYAAHELTLPLGQRQKTPDTIAAAYAADQKLSDRYNGFLKQDPVKTLLAHGADVKVEPLAATMLEAREGSDNIGIRYRMSYPNDGQTESFESAIVVERLTDENGEERWMIQRSMRLEDPPTN